MSVANNNIITEITIDMKGKNFPTMRDKINYIGNRLRDELSVFRGKVKCTLHSHGDDYASYIVYRDAK